MTLAEALILNADEFIYLGSGSAYLYIGNTPTAEEISELSDSYLRRYKNIIKKYKCEVKSYPTRRATMLELIEREKKQLDEYEQKNSNYAKIKDYLAKADKTSEGYKLTLSMYEKSKYKSKTESMRKSIENNERLLYEYEHRVASFSERIGVIGNILFSWNNFLEREVVCIYEHESSPKGKIIIMDGEEKGEFWFYEEYQRKKEMK